MRRLAPVLAAPALAGCAEGTDYAALWIEHGPGWWKVLGLILLVAWLARKKGFLDGLTELSAFGVQLKRDVGRVDAETETLAEEIAALRADAQRMRSAVAVMQADAALGRMRPTRPRRLRSFLDDEPARDAGATDDASARARDAEPRLRVRLHLTGGLSDAEAPGRRERLVEIGGRPYTVGRDPRADLSLVDAGRRISRQHLELAVVDGVLNVRDRSADGTGLNDPGELLVRGVDTPLQERTTLHLGAGALDVAVEGEAQTPTAREGDAAPAPTPPPPAPAADPSAPPPSEGGPGAGGGGSSPGLDTGGGTGGEAAATPAGDAAAGSEAATARRVEALLADPRFEWRSLGRLAAEVGMEEADLRDWLAGRPERYRLGASASGRPLVRRRTP